MMVAISMMSRIKENTAMKKKVMMTTHRRYCAWADKTWPENKTANPIPVMIAPIIRREKVKA